MEITDLLVENTVFVADAVTVTRDTFGGHGIQVAGSQAAQPAIAQARVPLHLGHVLRLLQPIVAEHDVAEIHVARRLEAFLVEERPVAHERDRQERTQAGEDNRSGSESAIQFSRGSRTARHGIVVFPPLATNTDGNE